MDKTQLVEVLAAQRSPYSDFSDNIKKAEAETEIEWLSEIARIAKGVRVATRTAAPRKVGTHGAATGR